MKYLIGIAMLIPLSTLACSADLTESQVIAVNEERHKQPVLPVPLGLRAPKISRGLKVRRG